MAVSADLGWRFAKATVLTTKPTLYSFDNRISASTKSWALNAGGLSLSGPQSFVMNRRRPVRQSFRSIKAEDAEEQDKADARHTCASKNGQKSRADIFSR